MFGFNKSNKNYPGASSTGLIERLRVGLNKTNNRLTGSLQGLFRGKTVIDAEIMDDIETILLTADVGIEVTTTVMAAISQRVRSGQSNGLEAVFDALKDELTAALATSSRPLEIIESNRPFVILMVGVNGAGKTTTIGKLAHRIQQQGKTVMLAAGDTFRAGAVEQLAEWGRRNEIPVIAQGSGADPASVIYDALQSAIARGCDVLIADTAGRLHTQTNLMEELKKVRRVMQKLDAQAPHEVMLVIDAGVGQNAVAQATQFKQALGVTGISLTKLDGTAKGGVIFSIAKQTGIPIRFIGIGEAIDDLRVFDSEAFVAALLQRQSSIEDGITLD